MPPSLSVIVPAYRSETTLRECLDSIIGQSFGDIEVLVVNDCSPDNVRGIAEEYAVVDSRVRVHNNAANQNLFDTRITGFALASGRYVAICDADDKLPPGALEAFARAMRYNPDIVHGRALELGGARDGKFMHFCDSFHVSTGADFIRALVSVGRGWNVWGKMFRTELVRRCLADLPKRTGWFMFEDFLFCLCFGRSAKSYHGIADSVYCYRYPLGTNSAARNERNSLGQIEIMGWLWKNAETLGLESGMIPALRQLFCRVLVYDIRRYDDMGREWLGEKIVAELGGTFWEEVRKTKFSRTQYLFPQYHLGYLKKHGIREYVRRMRELLASASRMGPSGTVQRMRGK